MFCLGAELEFNTVQLVAVMLQQQCLKTLYFAFVYPHLLHGIEVYANTGITHLTKLITLNNKILRILQNKP